MIKDWPTAIEDVTNAFQTQQLPNLNANIQIWIMMEVLCGIPEEASAISTSVHRAALRGEINGRAPFVLRIMEDYLKSKSAANLEADDMNTLLRTAKCAAVWLR